MLDFERPLLVGVIFDLSIAHGPDGRRNIDVIKDALIQRVLDNKVMSKIYVAAPSWMAIPRDQGESTYYIISYKEPEKFSIDMLFKQAVTVVGECLEDTDKHIFLFTDRFHSPHNYQYRKGFLTNEIRDYGIKISVFGIGDSSDNPTLKSMTEEYNGNFVDLKDVSLSSEKISGVLAANGN